MMALDLGLHKSATGLPLVEHERRVRVFWIIYVYEKLAWSPSVLHLSNGLL